jgi:hypothetical protein
MKTNDEILENITCCTITEDADLDVKENFYYQYEDVIKAMNEVRKQANDTQSKDGKLLIPHVSGSLRQLPTMKEYESEPMKYDSKLDSEPQTIINKTKQKFCQCKIKRNIFYENNIGICSICNKRVSFY